MNYLTLLEVVEVLSDALELEEITAGTIDESLQQTIGVYQRAEFQPRDCIGGESSYETARLRILIRWGTNPTAAESKAIEVAQLIEGLREMPTTAHIIKFAEAKAVRPIGKDQKGVCEYVVDADIYYSERNE